MGQKGRKIEHMNQGDLLWRRGPSMLRAGVRTSIVATKGRNGPGGKGRREVER